MVDPSTGTPDPPLDVFDTFETAALPDDDPAPSDGTTLAKSAGVTLALMVLTGIAFVAGFGWGTRHEPEVGYDSLAWEIAIKIGYAVGCGLLLAAVVLALGVLAVGLPWVRRQRALRRGRELQRPAKRTH